MSAPRHKLRIYKPSGGFSLVEIMVGMLIGLLGMMIMLQMLSFSEGQKRVTAGSDDAQNAGAIALYGIQRDIQQSGYGISTQNIIGCSLTFKTSLDNANVSLPLAPVTINSNLINALARDANTDSVMVIYGSSNSSEEGDTVSAQPAQTQYKSVTPTSYNPNDKIVAQYAARQSPCSLTGDQVVSTYVYGTNPIIVQTGIPNLTTTNKSTTGGYPLIYNLGQSPKILVYAIRGGNLTVCDYTAYNCAAYITINTANQTEWVPISGNIVSLKAQYGRDTCRNHERYR